MAFVGTTWRGIEMRVLLTLIIRSNVVTFSLFAWILLFHPMLVQGIDFWRQGSGREQVTIIARGILSTPSLLKRSGLKNQNIGISREPDG